MPHTLHVALHCSANLTLALCVYWTLTMRTGILTLSF